MSTAGSLSGIGVLLVLVSASGFPAHAQIHRDFPNIGTRNINRGTWGYPNRWSPSQEAQHGALLDRQIRSRMPECSHTSVADYLQKLAEEIARRSDLDGAVQICLTEDQDGFAFATLGGYVYVDEKLFRVAENEAEIAGVLAHEIGHLAARHGAENLTRKQMIDVNATAYMTLLRQNPMIGSAGKVPGLDGFWIAVRQFNETEADELAVQYLWKAGYDPEALERVLERIGSENWSDHGAAPLYAPGHPPISVRRKSILSSRKLLPPLDVMRLDSSAYQAARRTVQPPRTPLEFR